MTDYVYGYIYEDENKARYLILWEDYTHCRVYDAESILTNQQLFVTAFKEMRDFMGTEMMSVSRSEFKRRYGSYDVGEAVVTEMEQRFFLTPIQNVPKDFHAKAKAFHVDNLIEIFQLILHL